MIEVIKHRTWLLDLSPNLYLRSVWSGHGENVVSDPVGVDSPQSHVLLLPRRPTLVLAPVDDDDNDDDDDYDDNDDTAPATTAEHGTLHLIRGVVPQTLSN